jgi:hypothetical protein
LGGDIGTDGTDLKRDHKQLLTWQVLMQEKMDRFQERTAALDEKTDKRIADLVRAIDKLIEGRGAA